MLCVCHLIDLAAGKAASTLSVKVDDVYYYLTLICIKLRFLCLNLWYNNTDDCF